MIKKEDLVGYKSKDKARINCDNCGKISYKSVKRLRMRIAQGHNTAYCNHRCAMRAKTKRYAREVDIKDCVRCSKKFSIYKNNKKGKLKKYCSRNCANKDLATPRESTVKTQISASLKKTLGGIAYAHKYLQDTIRMKIKVCAICENLYLVKKKSTRKACSKECHRILKVRGGRVGGKRSSYILLRRNKTRSNSEKKLYDLLSKKFFCLHNIPLFDGLDADVIIPELKLVVWWNGPVHYRPIYGEEKFQKTKERDERRLISTFAYGYSVIIVRDVTTNKMTPQRAFNTVLQCIKDGITNCTIF